MGELTRERAAQLFAALSNPSRLRIVELLCTQEMSVGDICDALSLGQSATSQNLAQLTRVGVLAVEQRGASRIYHVRGPRIRRILDLIEEFCRIHELYGVVEEASGDDEADETPPAPPGSA